MGTSRHQPPHARRGSISAAVLGIVVFLAGIALLAYTFQLANAMFSAQPEQVLGSAGKPTFDLALAGQSLIAILTRVLVLIVMGLMGSLIANKGISLFAGSRLPQRPEKPVPPKPARVETDGSESISTQREISP